ncbi:MAG TPA: membrane protein insertase YidC [Nitrospirota bacterium]|nr:membrane protein insertase YidC [Nitrospirota bacterium]
METRRFILALSLSLIVFVLYVRFFAPKPPEMPAVPERAQQQAAQEKAEKPATATLAAGAVATRIVPAVKGKDIVVETDLVRAVVNTAGGVITGVELKHYREGNKTPVGLGVLFDKIMGREKKMEAPKKALGNVQLVPSYDTVDRRDMIAPLTITPLDKDLSALSQVEYRTDRDAIRLDRDKPSDTLVLTYAGPGGIVLEKRLTFHNDSYRIDVTVNTKGVDGYRLFLGTDFGLADKVSKDASGRVGFAAMVDGKAVTDKLDKIKGELPYSGTIAWFGQEDKYFTAALLYGDRGIVTARKAAAPPESGDLLTSDVTIKEKPEARTFALYAGPKSFTLLEAQGHGLEQMVDYGWFGILAKPMFWLLQQFYRFTSNYGVAIILLTIVVRLLLFYPSLKSATAMEEMKKIQPQLTALREKYKKDPQRMNQEMMKMYKEHKVNPLGGCLPMLLQLPFFVALYNVLSVSIELRQSPFLSFWIKDLSSYDPFYILPILMGVSMVFTMKMTSTSVDPQQQKIMMFMNIAFIFLFAWLPAGLLLYITLSNVLSIVQQLYVRKLIGASSDAVIVS